MRRAFLRISFVTAAVCILAGYGFAQTCNSSTADDAPASRYQANADGTASDLRTGLMWTRCALGQNWNAGSKSCNGKATLYDWEDALQAVQTLDQGSGYAGHADWRMPNLRELMSLSRYHCSDPAINSTIFPNTDSAAFWSSSPIEGRSGEVWAINFDAGQAFDDIMANQQELRLVRAGAFDNEIPPPASSAPAAVIH
ncbi:MAG TPA: DUF1566 domain-containing protein [Gammaproteobacteria bacterium]|nr:DUF1566 domain-containing protein [Gammaproteobacteria bacterium]